tara:strand:- start:965 stop:1603 length:639 start_codon:yes stop_codon:yes gene_type:complete
MQKGNVYYYSKCKDNCPNATKSLSENEIIGEIQNVIDTIHFTDEELTDIEGGRKSGLRKAASMRDEALADIERKRKNVLENIDYLKEEKVTILREGVMTPTELNTEREKYKKQLREIDEELKAYMATEEEMLDFVLTFSELIKEASTLYKDTTAQEKQHLTTLVFSELTIFNGNLLYKPSEDFAPILNRPRDSNGGAEGIRTLDPRVANAVL